MKSTEHSSPKSNIQLPDKLSHAVIKFVILKDNKICLVHLTHCTVTNIIIMESI
jgi:hypothetical protein